MKLIVTQENLNRALQVVGRVASGKTPLPILNNILFRTDKNRLLLAATNLECVHAFGPLLIEHRGPTSGIRR